MKYWASFLIATIVATNSQFSQSFAQERKRASLNVEERKRANVPAPKASPRLNRSALFAVEVEKKLLDGIDKTVAFLRKTAASLPKKSPQRLQIQERILNLYMEQASYTRSEEERSYDKQWRAWDQSGKKGREPRMNNTDSMNQWKFVVRQSNEILKEYPRAENADTITFNQAVALAYLGRETDAARIYTQLIQRYPNSAISGEAYAALGDFYFDRNDYRNAQKNFKAGLKYKRSRRYVWSIFKLGWCSFNLNDYRGALRYWKQVVKIGRSGSQQASLLKDDALRDMVFAFAELRQIEQAIAYYRANGGSDFIGPFLTLLAQILADQGEYAKAIKVLKRFQAVIPDDPKASEAQKEIVSLFNAMGDYNNLWRELSEYNKLYGSKSSWARKQNPALVKVTDSEIRDQMLYYASLTHQKAIEDDNKRLNSEAKKGYLLYLQSFPKSKEIPAVKYYLADIEYYLGNYQEAGKYYFQIAALGKENAIRFDAKSKKAVNIHRESAVYMVNSFVKDFEDEFNALKKRKPNFKSPKAISPRARNYIAACERYGKWYPTDQVRVKSCDTGVANIFYHSGRQKEAVAYLRRLAIKYPRSKEGPAAIDLLIPIIAEDRALLLSAANDFLKVPEYRNGAMGSKLRNLQRGAEKEAIAKESDTLNRAKLYEAQARKYPKDPEVDKLWYNAAVDYIKAGAVDQALAAYSVVFTRFPKNPQAQESLLQVAQIYERQLRFDKAAEYFLKFTKTYPKSKATPGALSSACQLQIAMNTSRALSVCLAFANRFPDGAKGFIEQLISGAERAKRYSQMVQIIEKYYLNKFSLNQNERIVAWYRIYRVNSGAEAATAASRITGLFTQNPEGVSGEALRYVGELYYRQAQASVPRYLQIKLQGGSVERLLQSMAVKTQALSQLEASMNQVVATKDAYWGVAALYQLGAANEHYADLLENPPKIDGAKKADVVAQLRPQIDEIRRTALSQYRTAQETVSKFSVYNEWSIKIARALAKASGSRLAFDDYIVQPDFLGSEMAANIADELR